MTITGAAPGRTSPRPRPLWRQVAVPTEHGGWGLTLEPVLLGLLLAPSWSGAAIGVVALLAFVVRTPIKVLLVDRRRRRRSDRTVLAGRVAGAELAVVVGLIVLAVRSAGWAWMVVGAVALPLVAVELWFDARSRSRRLVPELAGACAMAAVAAAIVVAGGRGVGLAVAAWLLASGRAIMSIAFVRTQIERLHRRPSDRRSSNGFQVLGSVLAGLALAVDHRLAAGAGAVLALALVHVVWVRRNPPRATILGIAQMVLGLLVVVVAAAGARLPT